MTISADRTSEGDDDLVGCTVVAITAIDGKLTVTLDNGSVLWASFYRGEGAVGRNNGETEAWRIDS